jgi:hypothetical protein
MLDKKEEIIMRYFEVIAVPGLFFGPPLMVMSGYGLGGAWYGLVGAFGLSFGLVYIFRMLHSLKNELDELKKHGANDAA